MKLFNTHTQTSYSRETIQYATLPKKAQTWNYAVTPWLRSERNKAVVSGKLLLRNVTACYISFLSCNKKVYCSAWETWLSFQLSEPQWPKLTPSVSIINIFSLALYFSAASLRLTMKTHREHYSPKSMFVHSIFSPFIMFKTYHYLCLTEAVAAVIF